jgi:hypothetical protein
MLVVALLLAVSVPELATAQQRKAGINAAAFLKIGVGARQVALGSAVTSMGGDITNMFWNPAGIAMKDDRIQAAASYNNWIAGLAQNVLAAGYNIPDIGTLGVGFMTFGISDIPADRDVGFTDPQLSSQVIDQSNSGTYDYQDMMVQATFSRYISDNLSLGASVKYLHEKIDDQSTSAIAFDLGSVYNIGFLGWSIGARLNNLGGDFKYYDYAQPIPLTFSIGTSMTPISVGSTNVLFAVDLVKPQDGQQYYYAGTEIGVQKMFFLRGGWKFNYSWFGLAGDGIDEGTSQRAPIQTSLERGSFGAGVRVPLDEYTVTFDYAYTVFISLDAVHRFTVAFSMK